MWDLNKAVGLPLEADLDHKYSYVSGFYGIKNFWYTDKLGNYWRYTNAPVDHKDYDERLGEPLIHPVQPLPHTNPEYFTPEGYKRNQAVAEGLLPQRNQDYNPASNKQVWFEVVQSGDLIRYIYKDSDVRERLDLWVQYQLRLADSSLLSYRQYYYNLFNNSQNIKDRVLGAILILVDQSLYLPEELVKATVGDIEFIDQTVKLLGKKFTCDLNFYDFIASLTQDRKKDDPLFIVPTVHGRQSLGFNYIYSVLEFLRMNPYYLIAWHANHMFSRIVHRMSIMGVPKEKAEAEAYIELSKAMSSEDDVSYFIDQKVHTVLFDNYGETQEVSKALTDQEHDSFGVFHVVSDLVERRTDELEFSMWLHAEPMHSVSDEEEEEIQEILSEIAEQQEPVEEEQQDTGGAETAAPVNTQPGREIPGVNPSA